MLSAEGWGGEEGERGDVQASNVLSKIQIKKPPAPSPHIYQQPKRGGFVFHFQFPEKLSEK